MKNRVRMVLVYVAAFVGTPLIVGLATVAYRFRMVDVTPAVPYLGALPTPAVRDPAKLDAVVLAGNAGTEGSDFLVPYQILAMSGSFNVYAASPERRISPLTPESVDIIPDASLAGVTRLLDGKRPDLIVIPYLPNAAGEDRAVLEWVRANAGDGTLVLAICGGSQVLALSGLLDGRRATSHHNMLDGLAVDFPEVEWVGGLRYVEDGPFVTSGAILAGFDATLHVVRRMVGEDVARRVAAELEYPHVRFLDDAAYEPPQVSFVGVGLNIAYRWRRARVGLEVTDRMAELELAAAIDTYPHSFALRLISFAPERRVHFTRHGLAVVPRRSDVDASSFAWTVAPGAGDASDGHYPFETRLTDLARRYGTQVAAAAAWGLGYPASDAILTADAPIPFDPMVRPMLLGMMGVAVVGLMRRRRPISTPPQPPRNGRRAVRAAYREPTRANATAHISLTARSGAWEIAPGRSVDAWTYDGELPGPTIVANVGDTVVVELTNHLAEPTTIHWHGIRLPAAMDGTELTQRAVAPGETFEYRFTVPDAGTFWYHPHMHESVQMERGLYGALIVRGAGEPTVDRERVLLLDDMRLDRNGGFARFGGILERHNGRQGAVRLVNGLQEPELHVSAGQIERWRLINAASARYARLSIGGKPFRLIGTDGGLIERPVAMTEIVLAPGERADLLIGPFEEGELFDVLSLPYDRGVRQRETERFATVRVDPREPSLASVPDSLRAIPRIARPTDRVTREIRLGGRMSLRRGVDFTIDGEVHEHEHRPVRVGEVQVWDVVNDTPIEHPFHLHGFFFQVMEIDGVEPAFRAWKDTVNVPAKGRVRIAWLPDDGPGPWMYHCHILEHAEAGMMAHFEVVDVLS